MEGHGVESLGAQWDTVAIYNGQLGGHEGSSHRKFDGKVNQVGNAVAGNELAMMVRELTSLNKSRCRKRSRERSGNEPMVVRESSWQTYLLPAASTATCLATWTLPTLCSERASVAGTTLSLTWMESSPYPGHCWRWTGQVCG